MLEIIVPGRPRPKQRPRVGRNGNVYTPRQTQVYEQQIKWRARVAMGNHPPLTGPVGVQMRFYFKGRRTPDADNCEKAILDAMQGIVYENDRQVKHTESEVLIGEPERVEVWVWSLAN